MRIRDLMTTDVITVGPDTQLKEAARRMLQAGVSGLPVTEDGQLVGIITEADFVKTEADRGEKRRAGLLRFFVRDNGIPDHRRTVGDVMTTDIRTVTPDSDHVEAARIMEIYRVKRLPVVEDWDLVGLVSRSDMMRAFVRPDAEIIDEIRTQVLKKVMWVDPNRVNILCEDGNLALSGKLETRSDAELLVELVKRVDGVASIESSLTWEIDNTKMEMTGPRPSTTGTGAF